MQDRRLHELRRQLAGTTRGRGRRYRADLKASMIAWARAAIASGTTLTAAAALLEIHAKTLTAWLRPPPRRSTALVPVEVIAAPALPASAMVALVSPAGFRIEGLTVDEALRAIARLG